MEQYLLDKLTDIERHKAVEQLRKERGNRPLHSALQNMGKNSNKSGEKPQNMV